MGIRIKPISEKEFTSQVLAYAKLRGWRSAHFRSARTAKGWATPVQGDGKGFPDLVLVRGEKVIIAELKVGKNKATKEQAEWLTAFADANLECYVWRPEQWAEIEEVLR